MQQLEKRSYTKNEIAIILGIDTKSTHFKRDVNKILEKWGYEFEYPPYSKTITITAIPEGELKLNEILIREYNIDARVDYGEFTCFIHAFSYISGFDSMPWGERVKQLKEVYGVEVCDRTLRNWAEKLFDSNTFIKTNAKTYWKSIKISETETHREQIEKEEFISFYEYRQKEKVKYTLSAIESGRVDYEEIKIEAWKTAHYKAMSKFNNWCYFSCKTILIPSFDDKEWVELLELVDAFASGYIEAREEDKAAFTAKRQEAVAATIASGDFNF